MTEYQAPLSPPPPQGQPVLIPQQPYNQSAAQPSQSPTQPPKKQRIGLIVGIIVGVIVLSLAAWFLSNAFIFNQTDSDTSAGKTNLVDTKVSVPNDSWSVYIYICGSNLESKGGYATKDLEEIQKVKLPANVQVVIETGGANAWKNGFNKNYLQRYLYDANGLKLIQDRPSASMGNPNTLAEFLTWANTEYPAKNRMVVLWDHGAGSLRGYGSDELFQGDGLTLPELNQAFQSSSKTISGEPLYQIIGFDACLMATVDMAGIAKNYSNYLVASQETEPGIGWDYTGFVGAIADNPAIAADQLGKAICDSYYTACEKNRSNGNATLSVVDLSKIDPLLTNYNAMGDEALVGGSNDTAYFGSFGRAARSAENYVNNETDGYSDMVDLGDLAQQASQLLPVTSAKVLTALDDAVVYQVKGPYRSKAHGLSCYYHYDGAKGALEAFSSVGTSRSFGYFYEYSLTGKLNQNGLDYVKQVSGNYISTPVTPAPLPDVQGMDLEGHAVTMGNAGHYSLELTPTQAQSLSAVYVMLAYHYSDQPDTFSAIFGISHNVAGDWQNGSFMDKFTDRWGSIDGLSVYMEPIETTDAYILYSCPILLNDQRYSLMVVFENQSQSYQILGARRIVDAQTGMVDKDLVQLAVGDVIQPIHYILLGEGQVDEQTGSRLFDMPLGELTVTQDTRFYENSVGDGRFSVRFVMFDRAGETYLSAPGYYNVQGNSIQPTQ